jgi:hypothetical protein
MVHGGEWDDQLRVSDDSASKSGLIFAARTKADQAAIYYESRDA